MDYNTLLGIIGGLGLGTLLNSVVSSLIAKKTKRNERLYEEKRTAYLGLLSALHKAAVKPSNESSKEYALWQTQCSLFGSDKVAYYAQMIVDTNDSPRPERDKAFKGLIEAMRSDLSK
jgi:hypothetical protein